MLACLPALLTASEPCKDLGPWPCDEKGCPSALISCTRLKGDCFKRFDQVWQSPPSEDGRSLGDTRVYERCPQSCNVCPSEVEASDGDGDSQAGWLMSTEWHWNAWRNVKFHAPRRVEGGAAGFAAKFWAPTADCEAGLCTWTVNGSEIRIRWGDAGWHTLVAVGRKELVGARDEHQPVRARE